jgi:dihydroorotase
MTLYLTDNTPPAEIVRAREAACVHAVKLYPAGATTNSDAGVTDLARVAPVLAALERPACRCSCTARSPARKSTCSTASGCSSIRVLAPLLADFPALRVVLEHITTAEAVAFVESGPPTRSRRRSRRTTCSTTATPARRRGPPALLLPAGAEARHAPAGARPRRHQRLAPLLPRHRFGAARARTPRSAPAAAPASTAHTPHSRATPACSRPRARSIDWKAFASQHGADFYGLSAQHAARVQPRTRTVGHTPASAAVRRRHAGADVRG